MTTISRNIYDTKSSRYRFISSVHIKDPPLAPPKRGTVFAKKSVLNIKRKKLMYFNIPYNAMAIDKLLLLDEYKLVAY